MKAEPFYDERLSPQQNKAVEMLRNGFERWEIADEMDIDRKHLDVLFYNARQAGVDVPKAKGAARGRKPRVSIERLAELREQLTAAGFKNNGMLRTIAERVGLSETCVKVRLWRYDKGIQPKYARGQQ